jgi:hypothetical protein
MDASYGFSYARDINPLLSVGVTGRYLSQEIDSTKAATWAGDVGVLQRIGQMPLSLGLAVKNFGQAVEFKNTSDPLPFAIDAGLGATFMKDRLLIGLDGVFPRDNNPYAELGGEYKLPLAKDLRMAFRGGLNTAGRSNEERSGLSFGAGVGFRQFDLDFAFIPYGNLGNTFRYSLRVRF